jgi:hypothetical protein
MSIANGLSSNLLDMSPIDLTTAHPWNLAVGALDDAAAAPIDSDSAALLTRIYNMDPNKDATQGRLWYDFGLAFGLPYGVVDASQPLMPVAFNTQHNSANIKDTINQSGGIASDDLFVTMTHDNNPAVPSTIWFRVGDILMIDQELCRVKSVVGTLLGIERAYFNTTAAAHANAARVLKIADYDCESDLGFNGVFGYPIPEDAKTNPGWYENGEINKPAGTPNSSGDRHMLIIQKNNWWLFELSYMAWDATDQIWRAGYGATWNLYDAAARPYLWSSTDAAGMQVLPGIPRYDEIYLSNAPIKHAFRCSVHHALSGSSGLVWPATHAANPVPPEPDGMPMGLRLRLKATFDIDAYLAARLTAFGYSAHVPAWKRVLQAMKTYGLIVCDRGGNMFCQGSMDTSSTGGPSTGWDVGVLRKVYTGLFIQTHFEVVRRGWNDNFSGFAGKPKKPTIG